MLSKPLTRHGRASCVGRKIQLPIRGLHGIGERRCPSRRLPAYPIATRRQLSTTPTAANISQLMLFFMLLTPHRCLSNRPRRRLSLSGRQLPTLSNRAVTLARAHSPPTGGRPEAQFQSTSTDGASLRYPTPNQVHHPCQRGRARRHDVCPSFACAKGGSQSKDGTAPQALSQRMRCRMSLDCEIYAAATATEHEDCPW